MIVNSTSLYIPFAEKSFHTIVTSPPYFGLRAYSGKQEHDWPGGTYSPMTGVPACVEVPAWHGGYGAEPTVEMYVWHTLLVMRECWRVLRDDGVMWWNLGGTSVSDAYRSRHVSHVPAYDNDGTIFPDLKALDCVCSCLCDEHQDGFLNHLRRIVGSDQLTERDFWQKLLKAHGIEHSDFEEASLRVSSLSALASTILEFLRQLQEGCSRCSSRVSGLYTHRSSFDDVQACVHMSHDLASFFDCNLDNVLFGEQQWLHNQYTSILSRVYYSYVLRSNIQPHYTTIKTGNIFGVPQRVMLAAQADGWVVRNDNIWAKKSAMPESVNGWRFQPKRCKCVQDQRGSESYRKEAYGDHPQTDHDPDGSFAEPQADPDCEICNGTGEVGAPVMRKGSWRHTRSHEYVFMFTKSMGYYANAEFAKESVTGGTHDRGTKHRTPKTAQDGQMIRANESWQDSTWDQVDSRNPRTVMSPSPAPWKGAHYAVFPPDLISPLIRATTPTRCCPHCGQAWAPIVVKKTIERNETYDGKHKDQDAQSAHKRLQMGVKAGREAGLDHDNTTFPSKVVGYYQTCKCPEHEPVPGIVYDPFFGSGTTGQVARELGLRFAGTDISFEYITEQAILRAEKKTPKNALKSLPMFAHMEET